MGGLFEKSAYCFRFCRVGIVWREVKRKIMQSTKMKNSIIETRLMEQLARQGLARILIPWFIKDLLCAFLIKTPKSRLDVNRRLRFFGWAHFEIDYQTYRVAKAYFES